MKVSKILTIIGCAGLIGGGCLVTTTSCGNNNSEAPSLNLNIQATNGGRLFY
jgi:hypothetical protein